METKVGAQQPPALAAEQLGNLSARAVCLLLSSTASSGKSKRVGMASAAVVSTRRITPAESNPTAINNKKGSASFKALRAGRRRRRLRGTLWNSDELMDPPFGRAIHWGERQWAHRNEAGNA